MGPFENYSKPASANRESAIREGEFNLPDEIESKPIGHAACGPRKTRTGKNIIALTNASAPPTAIPTIRNGSNSSHTIGYSTRATSANGQHNTNKMHHSRNFNMIASLPQPYPLPFTYTLRRLD